MTDKEKIEAILEVLKHCQAYLISGNSIWPGSGVHADIEEVIEKCES